MTVSIICLIAPYILLTTGILSSTLSPALSKVLPINPGVIAPIKVITTILIINPIPGIWCGNCLVKSKLSGNKPATWESIKVIMIQVT